MRRARVQGWWLGLLAMTCVALVNAAELGVSATSVAMSVGATTQVQVNGASGSIRVVSTRPAVATASLRGTTVTITGVSAGQDVVRVSDRQHTVSIAVLVSTASSPPPTAPPPTSVPAGAWRVLASNDLGMHCADLDYQVFSILPPFNVVHAQVLVPGTATSKPQLLTDADVDVAYLSTSSSVDPAGAGSVNTSNLYAGGFKSNFWQQVPLPGKSVTTTLGGLGYRALYPGAVLDAFSPVPQDTGLPVPDPAKLPALAATQQRMPGPTNVPQKFNRFDATLPFFAGFPFGTTVANANWFSADGIPILPVDDAGRSNPYPLMRVQAGPRGADQTKAGNVRGSIDIVLPVASEADCKNCHNAVDGVAAAFASHTTYGDGITRWVLADEASAPGPEKANNAAKINILRLHDAKWGMRYTSSVTGAPTPCRSGTQASCLDVRRTIQCSQCHYSPALDLAQVGPVDETTIGEAGRQQKRHISMSRAMHGNHGQYTDLFPAMPLPNTTLRTAAKVQEVLQETCYQCHPGKQTKCLRGAMANGGVVCQDCHGDMKQVGNDFSAGLPTGKGLDLTLRVPWAAEPKCQSCHVGDAKTVTTMNRSDQIVAADGIRNLLAYGKSSAGAASVATITSPTSRFAENQPLYRLSKGHGGVTCQNCHGSTHAEWPNPNAAANDNVAALQLQGHTGTLIECTACHAANSLAPSLNGPHGMHAVNDSRWVRGHGDFAERNPDACRACHGMKGQGSVLGRLAATRVLPRGEEGTSTITLQRGTQVRCDTCHEQKL